MTQTLLQLRTRARRKADMQDQTGFMPDTEVTDYVNQGISSWYDKVIKANDDIFFEERITFNSVAGQELYTIGSGSDIDTVSTGDFYRLVAVNITDGTQRYALHPYNRHDRTRLLNAGNFSPWVRYQYRLNNGKLSVLPTPNATQVFEFSYIPQPAVLSADGDVFDGINGWEEYITIWAAIQMLIKEESDIQALEFKLQQEEQRILGAAHNIQSGLPNTITDVNNNLSGGLLF